MNILPKKRWHVRTKENIARVRKDEALAAEQENERLAKVALAERESRIQFLREKAQTASNAPNDEDDKPQLPKESEHVNLFLDIEEGRYVGKAGNEEYDKERQQEKEDYWKKIGYLTYLGQDTNEALGVRSWYEKAPGRSDAILSQKKEEKFSQKKFYHDPLNVINLHLGKKPSDSLPSVRAKTTATYTPAVTVPTNLMTSSLIPSTTVALKKKKSKKEKKQKKEKKSDHHKHKKHKKQKKSSKHEIEESKEEKLQKLHKLREERLRREAAEKRRQQEILAKHNGEVIKDPKEAEANANKPRVKQKYNSQFNPELAKQNYEPY